MNLSYVSLAVTVFCFLFIVSSQFIIGAWIPALFFPLSIALISLAYYFYSIRKKISYYMLIKTKFFGFNFLLSGLIILTFLFCSNYLLYKSKFKWDLSEGKVNSLTLKSKQIVAQFKDSFSFVLLYKNSVSEKDLAQLNLLLQLYIDECQFCLAKKINIHTKPDLASQYLQQENLPESIVLFIETSDRKVKVPYPYDEVSLTNTLLKISKDDSKVYFITGHGERNLNDSNEGGLSHLKQSLNDFTIKALPLNLQTVSSIPKDAKAIAIIGPQTPLFTNEIKIIKSYLENGGKIFYSVDPGKNENLYSMFNDYGIEILPNYLVNDSMSVSGKGLSGIVGVQYNPKLAISKSFSNQNKYTLFDLASEISITKVKSIRSEPIVLSSKESYEVSDQNPNLRNRESRIIASFSQSLSSENNFSLVVVSDSDFLSNKDFHFLYNQEFSLNIFSYLVGDNELLKLNLTGPKATFLVLTPTRNQILVVLFLLLPVFFFSLSFVVWIRGRETK